MSVVEPIAGPSAAPALNIDGRRLETSDDVAKLLGERKSTLLYALYTAPAESRYTEFEIPKRNGGKRRISSPNGIIRRAQDTLKPLLDAAYRSHPAAHGFIGGRSILTNAGEHVGRRFVFNVDLADFFPSINFGRVRGLFMAPPFLAAPAAATVLARLCTHDNGLPQGASTSPMLSNLIASELDRRLLRLARENRLHYSRYSDDITFSGDQPVFPAAIAIVAARLPGEAHGPLSVTAGEALVHAIESSGFKLNPAKVRIHAHHQRQQVTGITVNAKANVTRQRVRKVRAMLHAWEKFGLEAAAREHLARYRHLPRIAASPLATRRFRAALYGELAFLKMVRGADDAIFLKFCAKVVALDPQPSRFLRRMVFGADDYEVFISHATEDKPEIARPIARACEALGIRAFLDEEHIAWGENFTRKINTALGAARTILCIVSSNSVSKDWPVAEMNAALDLEIGGRKRVLVVMVGKPDLSKLPLIQAKNYHIWANDPGAVAAKLLATLGRGKAEGAPQAASPSAETPTPRVPTSGVPVVRQDAATSTVATPQTAAAPARRRRWLWPFGT